MAEEKKVVEAEVKEAPKAEEKKASKKTKKATPAVEKKFKNPTYRDLEVLLNPVITEKAMDQIQNLNQVTMKVRGDANKSEIKLAFERVFQVSVTNVRVINVNSKETTRGSRYKGVISGYKKAIITVKEGEAVDLFKE